MRSLPVLVVLLALLTSAASGTGWVGQQMLNRPNGDTADGLPTVTTDQTGHPWVVWIDNPSDTTLLWTRWLGSGWEPQRGVSPDAPGVWGRCRPDLAFDEQDRAWLVWNNAYENNNRDGSQWTPEQQVNQPDSTDVDFAPKVACGGGQVWCVWYGGLTDVSPYSVFASRWDPERGSWELETQVSPPDGNNHWWCDVAVDSEGTPHVVWTETEHLVIYYSFYDGQQWTGSSSVNDSSRVRAASWAAPRIVIDRDGILHVCYTGVLLGTSRRDVYYTRNDGSGWTPSVRVTQDTAYNYHEWFSDIAADRPDNIWVVWDRQDEGPDQFRVYAAHFDGQLWSAERRLDDTSSYYDFNPAVCLDTSGDPWVFWTGKLYAGPVNEDVFFNRFVNAGLAEAKSAPIARVARLRCATLQSGLGLTASFTLAAAAQVRLALYDEAGRCRAVLADGQMPKGTHTVHCGQSLASGVYLCRFQAGGQFEVSKVVILGH
jgi:hypothetical protein